MHRKLEVTQCFTSITRFHKQSHIVQNQRGIRNHCSQLTCAHLVCSLIVAKGLTIVIYPPKVHLISCLWKCENGIYDMLDVIHNSTNYHMYHI